MASMAGGRDGVVVYASSFSKTVCPGIRVGYLVGPEELIARIATIATSTYISPNMVAQGIVNQFARSGAIDRSIDTVREALKERARRCARRSPSTCRTPASSLPRAATSCGSTCRDGTDVAAMFAAAAARGVLFVKGTDFVLEGGETSLRLAYSGVTPDQIAEGVKRLAEAYAEVGAPAHAA